MKLGLATGVLSSTPPPTPNLCLLRVDRIWDHASPPRMPNDDLPDESYVPVEHPDLPANQWEVVIDGEQLTLVQGETKLRGREASNMFNERRFDITEGAPRGGRFMVRGEDAELTLFGPTNGDVPIVSSERGKLIPR